MILTVGCELSLREQYDCQMQDLTITEQYVEYKERQTNNAKEMNGVRNGRESTIKYGRGLEESETYIEHS